MMVEKVTIRMNGLNLFTFENSAGEQPNTFNVPSAVETASATDALIADVRVSEGVRKAVSEYGEALRKLSNE